MSEPLKHMYSRALVEQLAAALRASYTQFNSQRFFEIVFDGQWESRELKQRTRHIAQSMRAMLPADYREALGVLTEVAPQFTGFTAIVFPDFVEVYGIDDYAASIRALELFTQFSTAEYAVRPFIKKYPAMMAQMLVWAQHPNHHVRRLASEGCRPRLPWGMALPEFKKDPAPVLPILEQLKADESEYVRRSVANNLNDIAKDNPEVVIRIARQWKGKHSETDRLVRHACRTLLKRAHPEALQLFGFGEVQVAVGELEVSPEVQIGGAVEFAFVLRTGVQPTGSLRVEYAIDYVKSGGKLSRKVFALSESSLPPSSEKRYSRKHSFRNMTTRTHYSGVHKIIVLVNGRAIADQEFVVV